MKTLRLLTTLAVTVIVFVLTACKKEQSIPGNQPLTQARNSGVVEDDALRVSKVPFVISSDLLTRGPIITSSSVASSSKGRKPGLGDIVPPSVSISSPTQGQTLDATTTTVSVGA